MNKTTYRALKIAHILIAASLITFIACSNTHKRPNAPTAPHSNTPTPQQPHSYTNAHQLAEALNSTGINCETWEERDTHIAETLGSCHLNGQEIVIATYTTQAQAAEQPAYLAALLDDTGTTINVIIGNRWTISCDEAITCTDIAHQFGGQLVTLDT